MAEVREGMQPDEARIVNPETVNGGVRESVVGVLNSFIDKNPVVREQARSMDRVQAALPEGRVKDAVGLVVDAAKGAQAGVATIREILKKTIPGFSLAMFVPELIEAAGTKARGFIVEKVVESGPVKFAVGSVDGVMDSILGERRPTPAKATLENSHQILVGMARPEMGVKERRKMT